MLQSRAVGAPGTVFRPGRRVLGRDWLLGYAMLGPVLLVLFGLVAYPFGYAVWLSLNDVKVGGQAEWVGLGNYTGLLPGIYSAQLFNSSIVTLKYVVFALAGKFVIGMTMALILHSEIRARNFFRALLFLPWAVPSVVAAFSWKWLYNANFGAIDLLGRQLGIMKEPVQWLASIDLAFWSIVAAVIWQGTPFWTMTYLAGLSSIPTEMYEAAQIDGASSAQSFVYITLPNLSGVILVTCMLSAIWTANSFQFIYILTNGGPAGSTETFPLLAYTWGIRNFDLGMGATVPLLFFPVFAVMIWFISRRLLKEA